MPPTLSYKPGLGDQVVDVDSLVTSRMLIQANSGGGKSRAIRQLLEQTHGRVPQIVLDSEGEFVTLREQFSYIVAGRGGDVPADPRSAKLLCRRILELGASAIVDLYDLKLPDRRRFVRLFLEELMSLPRDLWRPTLVVIDEAHVFAPERGSGESESSDAVITLCTQGRKRGYCAVLATQRLSKLHKDGAAELLNKLIGRTGLDVDVRRAGEELGFDKEERQQLKTLKPGQFFAYGPAIANAVILVQTGAVVTTHPEAGRVGSAPIAPPSAAVQKMLQQLRDLPKQAEDEARTVTDLQRQVRELQAAVRKAENGERVVEKPVADPNAIARAVDAERAKWAREFKRLVGKDVNGLAAAIDRAKTLVAKADASMGDVLGAFLALDGTLDSKATTEDSRAEVQVGNQTQGTGATHPSVSTAGRSSRAPARPVVTSRASTSPSDSTLGKGERIVLTAVAQYPDGAEREQLTILTGYKRSSRDTYIQRLQAAGFVETAGGTIRATDAGVDALGPDFAPLPTGEALRTYWLDRLSGGEAKILEVLIAAFPDAVSRDTLSEMTEYKRSSRDTYLQRLQGRRLVETVGRSEVRASAVLFEEG